LLRLEPGIEVLEREEGLWLRGPECDERRDSRLRTLPGAQRFAVLPDGQLQPVGKRLPHGRLPGGIWQSIRTWAGVELPVAKMAAQSAPSIEIKLERTTNVTPSAPAAFERPGHCSRNFTDHPESDCLVTTRVQWLTWGECAPQVRLERLAFAAASDGRVLVRGNPLPPLPGDRFYERAGLAVPCGWGWPEWLDAALVREVLDLPEGDLALFSPDGSWELIPADQFVRATRSAVRLSVEK